MEKQNKTIQSLAEYLRKTVKISNTDTLAQLNPIIDQKQEFSNTKPELRQRAIDEVKRSQTRAKSVSSESDGSQ